MSEEKRRILEMLEAGKITQEDAARLLDALGEEGDTDEPQKSLEETVEPHKSPEEPVGTSEEKADRADLLGNLGAGVDKAVQEAVLFQWPGSWSAPALSAAARWLWRLIET